MHRLVFGGTRIVWVEAGAHDLRAALSEANDLLRSMSAIADRDGAETNWPALRAKLDRQLKIQHAILYPVSDAGVSRK